MRTSNPKQRPWAIRRWCLWSSLALATIAELALLTAIAFAITSGNRNPGLLALPLIWPVFYAGVFGVSYAIAQLDQRGPMMEHYPQWYRDRLPRPAQWLLNTMFPIGPNIALLISPVIMNLMSGVVLWAAASGRLNA
jgi:hypothetical protein